MSQIDNVAYGLAIFRAYGAEFMQAEHDIVYCGPKDGKEISDSDKATLESMNWSYDEGLGCWYHFV